MKIGWEDGKQEVIAVLGLGTGLNFSSGQDIIGSKPVPSGVSILFGYGWVTMTQYIPGLMILSAQHRLLATSHGFCQKTKFQPGAALLINIIIDCNYLTSPYIPSGTWREMCFAKWSFYLCKIVQACSGVLSACVKLLEAAKVHASVSSKKQRLVSQIS